MLENEPKGESAQPKKEISELAKMLLRDEIPDAEIIRIEEFGEKLEPYYRRYMMHIGQVIDPTSPSHPDRMREIGLRCRDIRKVSSLSRTEAAEQMEVDYVQFAAFEGGLISPYDLPVGFVQKLAGILGDAFAQDINPSNNPQE